MTRWWGVCLGLCLVVLKITWADSFNPQTDLPRLVVGIQAGIVKVLGPDRQTVVYARGLDEPGTARWDATQRQEFFDALALDERSADRVSAFVMLNYARLPHKEAVALLGVLLTSPALSAVARPKVEYFLVVAMNSDKQVEARRQAILALAVAPSLSDFSMDRVVGKFERCDNLWELFPMQQFFDYQRQTLRARKGFAGWRQRLARVDSIYTPAILQALGE